MHTRYTSFTLLLLSLVAWPTSIHAQGTVNGQFTTNVSGSTLTVTVQLLASPGNAGLGTSTIQITYNNSALTFDSGNSSFSNFSGSQLGETPSGHNAIYNSSSISTPNANEVSLNIVLDSCLQSDFSACDPVEGEALPSTLKDVATLQFTITDAAQTANLAWDTIELFNGAGAAYTNGTFTTNDSSLPVELVDLGWQQDGEAVWVSWKTASETNNAGFAVEVQAVEAITTARWQEIAFVEGRGTTIQAQQYRHRMDALAPGQYRLRLRQMDYDGAVAYSDELEIKVGLVDLYEISEVYPNPVHSKGQMHVVVRAPQHVEVVLYDMLGRRVSELHNGTAGANETLTVSVSGWGLSSGVYLVRVKGERFAATRRFTLNK